MAESNCLVQLRVSLPYTMRTRSQHADADLTIHFGEHAHQVSLQHRC